MKSIVRNLLVTGAVVASTFAFAQADKVVMGVSIPFKIVCEARTAKPLTRSA